MHPDEHDVKYVNGNIEPVMVYYLNRGHQLKECKACKDRGMKTYYKEDWESCPSSWEF